MGLGRCFVMPGAACPGYGGGGRYMPTTEWPEYADSGLAGICRSRRGRYMPTPPPRRRAGGGRNTPTLKWPDYADC